MLISIVVIWLRLVVEKLERSVIVYRIQVGNTTLPLVGLR